MKKMEFQRTLAESLMRSIMEVIYQDDRYPNISYTTKLRTIRITLRIGMDNVNIYLPATGQVTYRLKEVLGAGERMIYYSYNQDDDHEEVIKKTVEDMTMLVAAFLKAQDLHDFADMDLAYEEDNTPVIKEYLDCYCSDSEDDDEDDDDEDE